MIKPVFYFLLLLLLCGCAIRAKRWETKKLIPSEVKYSITIGQSPKDTLKIIYTGCGGLVIAKGEEAFTTDPYYTGHSIQRVIGGYIKIDTSNTYKIINHIKAAGINPKNITTALIAHAHYDHLEDLPYLMQNKLLSDSLNIIGDSSTYQSIKNFLGISNYSFTNANNYLYHQSPKPSVNKWQYLSKHIRVMILEAEHAPHFLKYSIMKGQTRSKTFEHHRDARQKTNPRKWKRGKTYSYLVDITGEDDKPELRIFIQSSSCQAPYGFPPQNILNEKSVDVAFIGVASAQNVKRYPEDVLSYLRPQKVILIHWEDFFRDLYDSTIKKVRGTPMRRFVRHLRKHYNCNKTEELSEWFSMPKPLSQIDIRY
jgi:hypothetical protein